MELKCTLLGQVRGINFVTVISYIAIRSLFCCFFAAASGVFVSIMLLVLLLEGHLPSDIGNLPIVGE